MDVGLIHASSVRPEVKLSDVDAGVCVPSLPPASDRLCRACRSRSRSDALVSVAVLPLPTSRPPSCLSFAEPVGGVGKAGFDP